MLQCICIHTNDICHLLLLIKKILANSSISESLIKSYALSPWYSSQPNHSK